MPEPEDWASADYERFHFGESSPEPNVVLKLKLNVLDFGTGEPTGEIDELRLVVYYSGSETFCVASADFFDPDPWKYPGRAEIPEVLEYVHRNFGTPA